MTDEELDAITQQLVDFLCEQAVEYHQQEGRGVFFVKMETQEIIYVPENSLSEEVEDTEALGKIREYVGTYNPLCQFCFLVFGDNEVIFNIGEFPP